MKKQSTNENYLVIVKNLLAFNSAVSENIPWFRKKLEEMADGEGKDLLLALSKFIMKIESSIRILKKESTIDAMPIQLVQAVPLIPAGNPYGVEHFYIAQQLVKDAGFVSLFDTNGDKLPEGFSFVILRDKLLNPKICDACRVLHPHEHRCHRSNISIGEEKTKYSCQCQDCEERNLYMELGVFRNENYANMNEFIEKVKRIPA